MLELLFAAFLGLVQGLTEFLPVSSSGHLAVFQELWIWAGGDPALLDEQVAFNLVLHVGTLLPVLVMYRGDIGAAFSDIRGQGPLLSRPGLRLAAWVIVGTIPTGIIGLSLKDVFEQLFGSIGMVGIAFAVTGALLYRTRTLPVGKLEVAEMTWKHALIIGLAQGFAITPGISRSGTTIAVAIMLGLRRDLAARYSFLLSVPAILGAFVLEARHLDLSTSHSVAPLLVGFVVAALSGWGALVVLLKLVKTGDFSRFAWYLWPLAGLATAFWALRSAGVLPLVLG